MNPFTGHGFILWAFFWMLFGWFLIPAYIVIGLAWVLIGYPIYAAYKAVTSPRICVATKNLRTEDYFPTKDKP